MLKKTFLFLGLTFLISSAALAGNYSNCLDEVCFDSEITVGKEVQLALHRVAFFEFMRIDMYTAALYLPQNIKKASEVLSNVPKVLELYYHRGIKVKWMLRVAERMVYKNPNNDWDALEKRVHWMGSLFSKVGKGDRYQLSYVPDEGTSLFLNGEFVGRVPGEDFQRAYFGIWLAEDPEYRFNEDLYEQLIEGLK